MLPSSVRERAHTHDFGSVHYLQGLVKRPIENRVCERGSNSGAVLNAALCWGVCHERTI